MENREELLLESEIKTISDSYEPSLAYRILEEDFTQVIQELNRHDRLGHYSNEFQRLMDALRESHEKEKELIEKNKALHNELAASSSKFIAVAKLAQSDQEAIGKLKKEVEKAWRMLDAAHSREQAAQETIENLRNQTERLSQELETMRNMESDQYQEVGALSKNKEAWAREKERWLAEIANTKQRIAVALKYQEDLEKRLEATDSKLIETTNELEACKTELAKEKRFKEKTEEELKELKNDFLLKEQEYLHLNNINGQNVRAVAKLEQQVREEKITIDKQKVDYQELQNTLQLVRMELEQLGGKYELAQQEITSKNQEIKFKNDEKSKLETEFDRLRSSKEYLENKISSLLSEKNNYEIKIKDMLTKERTLEKEITDLKKNAAMDKKTINTMMREKDIMTRNIQKNAAFSQEQQKLISTQEFTKKKMQIELNEQMQTIAKLKTENSSLQNEKDRLLAESNTLNNQIQEQLEELKLKEMELFDYKKTLASRDAEIKLQMVMQEQLRSEKNQLIKNFQEMNYHFSEVKQKLKIRTDQVEQLKEDSKTKEDLLIKEEFVTKRVAKEKEEVKMELQKTLNILKEKKEQVTVLLQKENRLQKLIQEADKDKARLNKKLSQVSNERDILGTQLIRRNDELSLMCEKVKIFQSIMGKGDVQYEQRMEDIRLLKLEIKKLRQEKAMLARTINNVPDLRKELFHLERDCMRERLKCRALEEELQNPLNVHRWRKLEGSDPKTFKLIQKIQILQKRLLNANEEAIKRESRLKETERLYISLKKLLARQPGPETFGKLRKCKEELKTRGVKMKCLVAELTMYENQISGFKFEKEQSEKEISELKKKYLELKKKEQKIKQREKELEQEKSFLPVLEPITGKLSKAKFVGAGFNVASVTCLSRTPSVPMNA